MNQPLFRKQSSIFDTSVCDQSEEEQKQLISKIEIDQDEYQKLDTISQADSFKSWVLYNSEWKLDESARSNVEECSDFYKSDTIVLTEKRDKVELSSPSRNTHEYKSCRQNSKSITHSGRSLSQPPPIAEEHISKNSWVIF